VYDERGAGEALVFVHSGITDRRMWDPQVTAFPAYHTVRYDLQGFGGSDPTGPGTNREELLAFLDALGIERGHLVGASFGGGIALEAALERPERVRSLTLVGPAVGGHEYEADTATWRRVEELYEASVEAFEAGDLDRAAALEVELWVVGVGRAVETVDPTVREWVGRMDCEALAREAAGDRREDETALEPPALERLADLAVPTLLVVGEHDLPHVHDAVSRVVERAPDARRVVVDGAGHLPSLEQSAAFDDALRAFLDGR
jgi:pimeloyl-ACP methyl ester carboxylesterase